ncbi:MULTISPECIES: hypothetical protein [unclassified Streptomyces]|uniref:hypothetical protein n=1 Tax=unclassified Streptomyces TaxID=2593676 RepID=UPI0037A00B86
MQALKRARRRGVHAVARTSHGKSQTWKWAVPGLLLALVIQSTGILLLGFGIKQLGDAGPYLCDPAVQECVVLIGGGTPEEVAERQTSDAAGAAWLLILSGAAVSLLLPVSAVVGTVLARRERREGLERRARLERIRRAR